MWPSTMAASIRIGAINFARMLLPESKRNLNAKFDLLGFAMLGAAIAALQMMLDRGTMRDWFSSAEIIIETLLAALAFMFLLCTCLPRPPIFVSDGVQGLQLRHDVRVS